MIDNDPINVITAFEILIEEIEAELEEVNDHGSSAFQAGDYPAAQVYASVILSSSRSSAASSSSSVCRTLSGMVLDVCGMCRMVVGGACGPLTAPMAVLHARSAHNSSYVGK